MALPDSAYAQCFADGTIVREVSAAPVWVIHNCVKFWVPNLTELYALGGWSRVVTVPDGALASVSHIPADNTMVVERGYYDAQVVIAGASYYALSDVTMFTQLGGWANVTEIPRGSMWWTPPGSGLSPVSWWPRSGTMIRERTKPAVWVAYDTIGYWVSDPDELEALGGWGNVHLIPDQLSAPFRRCPADGTLLQERTQAPVWVVYGCTRYWVSDPTELFVLGDWSQVRVVPNRSITQNPPNYWIPVNGVPPEGAQLRERTGSDAYLIVAGAKFLISASEVPYFINPGVTVQTVPSQALTSAPPGFTPIPNVPGDGAALRERSGTTSYLIYGGYRYIITNPNDCPNQIGIVPNGTLNFPIQTADPYRPMTCSGPIG